MIKNLFISFSVVLLLLHLNACQLLAVEFPDARITLKVVDDDDRPVEGAQVSFTTQAVVYTKMKYDYIKTRGVSDENGLFGGTARSIHKLSYGAKKAGYYESIGEFSFKESKNGRWQPWNPELKVVLRKKINPVPMYARDTKLSKLEMPVIGKEVGFDLIEYEWMPPYGGGKHADLLFKLEQRYRNEKDFESRLIITFPGKFDGIQTVQYDRKHGSVFKLPRYAPEAGYQAKLVRWLKREPSKFYESDEKEENNYIFRIRSEMKDGKFQRAMYGKIQGDIVLYVYPTTAKIAFRYYLNADYTRNLEYDPTRNLFKGLPDLERVGIE